MSLLVLTLLTVTYPTSDWKRASCWDEVLSSLVQRLQALQVVSMTSCVKRRLKRAQINVKVCPSPPSPVDTPGISRCHVCGSWKFRQNLHGNMLTTCWEISLRSICRSYQCFSHDRRENKNLSAFIFARHHGVVW